MYNGPCIIVIVEEQETNLMSQFLKFYFTSVLKMFRTLIHPSSGACDFSIVSPHWLCVLVSMCVGVTVWLVGVVSMWQAEINTSIIRSLRLFYCITTLVVCSGFNVCWSFGVAGIPPQPATPKLQHTSKQEHTTNVVIQ